MTDSCYDVYTLTSVEETQDFAACLGRLVQGGEVLALEGDLGAGKTCFVQGLATGMDVPTSVYVRSPTFALIDEYPGRLPLFHLDLYRLEDEDELEAIGWRECLNGEAVVAVEWANRIPEALPVTRIDVHIQIQDGDTRRFELRFAPALRELQKQLSTAWNART